MITDYYEPAFPGQFVHGENEIESWVGISTRDYFAAKAMQGICASSPTDDFTDARIAQEAYNLADAMIKERKYGLKTNS